MSFDAEFGYPVNSAQHFAFEMWKSTSKTYFSCFLQYTEQKQLKSMLGIKIPEGALSVYENSNL